MQAVSDDLDLKVKKYSRVDSVNLEVCCFALFSLFNVHGAVFGSADWSHVHIFAGIAR